MWRMRIRLRDGPRHRCCFCLDAIAKLRRLGASAQPRSDSSPLRIHEHSDAVQRCIRRPVLGREVDRGDVGVTVLRGMAKLSVAGGPAAPAMLSAR